MFSYLPCWVSMPFTDSVFYFFPFFSFTFHEAQNCCITTAVQRPGDALYTPPPVHTCDRLFESTPLDSLPYVIPEICCIASSARFLFLSASHNALLCLLDDMPNNSSGRGCHGYGNRSDAPHLSLVTEERRMGTKVRKSSLFSRGGMCAALFPLLPVFPPTSSSAWSSLHCSV